MIAMIESSVRVWDKVPVIASHSSWLTNRSILVHALLDALFSACFHVKRLSLELSSVVSCLLEFLPILSVLLCLSLLRSA